MKRFFLLLLLISIGIIIKAQLPIVYLKGNFGYDYQEGEIIIVDSDTTKLKANIKWRGGSTNSDGKHKRNYKIKLDEDISLLGLREDNSWILDAGQADLFRLRNRIATDLWNDFAEKPYYYDKETDVHSGTRGTVVEVYLNDEYVGIYCLTEVIDRKQLKLRKFDRKTNTINGQLWKSKGYGCALMWDIVPYNNQSGTWDVFEAEYPDLDDLNSVDYSTLYNAIDFVINSNNDDFSDQVNEYFDLPVLIDYYIFLLTLNAYDNIGKNIYWATYNKNESKKLTLAVWDLDATVGQKWTEKFIVGSSSPEYDININMNLYVRLKELNANHFNEKVFERYFQLRKSHLSTDSLINRYLSYFNLIDETGAAQREEEKWSKDTDIDGQELNFNNEIHYIKNWFTKHMRYLDKKISSYSTDIKVVTDKKDDHYYNLNGQRVNKNTIGRGIYIKDGKKYVIIHK